MNKFTFFFKNLKAIFTKYESRLSALALVLGFTFDYFTLHRVDFFGDNIFIISYLILAGASILVINLYEAGRLRNNFTENIYEFLPFIVQLSFGGLFSAFVIFYSKSASLFTSGAFVLMLFTLLVGNEFFKKKYSKLAFQVAMYFTALFSFSIYFLPVLTKKMGAFMFLLSGVISLILIIIFILSIYAFVPAKYKENEKLLILTVFGLYVLINFLYFVNIIPPIPISLKNGDVYHFIQRQASGNYFVIGEKDVWYEKFSLAQKIHLHVGEPVYVFSSVFAPTDLDISIVHDWQYFDKSKKKWVSMTKITFPIKGGRDMGYRGFSKKENVFSGKWRVDVKTDRGQVIGRVRFDIEIGDWEKYLETKTL